MFKEDNSNVDINDENRNVDKEDKFTWINRIKRINRIKKIHLDP